MRTLLSVQFVLCLSVVLFPKDTHISLTRILMAKLTKKVQQALGENHILILGAHVLVGFQFRAMFEVGFDRLAPAARYLLLGGLLLMVGALALLLLPVSYHWIVKQGHTTSHFHTFTTTVIERALLPFAIGLGINLGIATTTVAGAIIGWVVGLVVTLLALFFWYVLEAIARTRRGAQQKEDRAMNAPENPQDAGSSKLEDQIDQVLEEARMVLPGAQALLGFQFAIMLVDSFAKLPRSAQYVHLVSFGFISLTTILLITPAAYHRLVNQGEDTPDFPRFASRMVLAAMVCLALGVSTDFYVVVEKVTGSGVLALLTSLLMLGSFYGLWFGYTLYRRWQQPASK
jgi:Family of unknown function (DUF6328)